MGIRISHIRSRLRNGTFLFGPVSAPSPVEPGKACRGFTLIELVTVIAILGMMLFFAAPRLDSFRGDDIREVSNWIMFNVAHLKKRALEDQKTFVLTVELDSNAFSIFEEATGEELEEPFAHVKTFRLPSHIHLVDVEYPGRGVVSTGKTDISMYPKGYSDQAVIHLQDESKRLRSFVIEPFLPTVAMSEKNIRF
ncbi:MAG: type II secretion system protein [Desulfobacterales bacterium]